MKPRRKPTKAETEARVAKMLATKQKLKREREQQVPKFVADDERNRAQGRGGGKPQQRRTTDSDKIALAADLVRLVSAILK